MHEEIPIIDAHVHVIPTVRGRNRFGKVVSGRCGCVNRGAELVPMLPTTCVDSNYPVESLFELMDRSGVKQAVLLQNPTLGTCNEYIGDCTQRYPDRFCGVIQIDPRDPLATETIRQFVSPQHHTLKMEMSFDWGWTGLYPDFRIDSAEMDGIWQTVADEGLEVIIDPGPPGNLGYQVEGFDALISRMPSTRFVLAHLGYLPADQLSDTVALKRRQSLLELGQRDNVWLGLSAVPTLLEESYPCPEVARLLREAVGLVGAEKLIWGSDAPVTLNLHTYQQLIDTVRCDSDFLSATQKRRILHDNAKTVFRGLNNQ
ncbi:amidohydrolase family protein [Crateriforma conspicua]|uniref:amidohydrolase family protein n=1 Tax=Crateriforma conspicua TaxID=2527996 RepID=UPI00118A542D|nr:amidohydrolase family protein [Crateriforma conspicua]QDV62445.1 Amidohydrolase [Crateriforma conspicua]